MYSSLCVRSQRILAVLQLHVYIRIYGVTFIQVVVGKKQYHQNQWTNEQPKPNILVIHNNVVDIFSLQTKTYMKITWEHRVIFFFSLPSFQGRRNWLFGWFFFRGKKYDNNNKKQYVSINKFELCVHIYMVWLSHVRIVCLTNMKFMTTNKFDQDVSIIWVENCCRG